MIVVRKLYFSIGTMLISILANAQDTYLPIHTEATHLLDRIQTQNGRFSPHFSALSAPISKNDAAQYLYQLFPQLQQETSSFTEIDRFNLAQYIGANGESMIQADGTDMMAKSKRPILKYFYTSPSHFLHIQEDDFFLTVNPILRIEMGKEQGNTNQPFKNLRGAEVRGHIGDRIGFYSMIGDNQERGLQHITDWERTYKSVPGYDYYRLLDNKSTDAFLGRAYVDVTAIKNHMNITFGYDKQFVGAGIRSLVLSDFSAPSTFLRLKTKWKRFTYENLYTELTSTFPGLGNDARLPRKYATLHQLNYNAFPWLQVGVFENSIFSSNGRFDATNLIPIIGYQSVAHSLGANQRTSWGMHFKALPAKYLQVYGQAMFDNIKTDNLSTANSRYAAQIGIKYFDAFTIPNLDIQLEGNYATPFMYTSADSTKSHTHYNQPLAHPLGAGFTEGIVQVKYQPVKKLYIDLQGIFAFRNQNSTHNAGTNILIPNTINYPTTVKNYFLQQGEYTGLLSNMNIAYELIPNLFIEVGGGMNHIKIQNIGDRKIYAYGGLRWNIGRRMYNYF